ncbi:MAG: hypothetical protein AAFR61_06410 [Bacteroidota bacterium]
MKHLSTDWFMEGQLDFEYKKYVLLAYLQHVSREFADYRLYPSFSELIQHYRNLAGFKAGKKKLIDQFPGKLSEEEFRQLRLAFEKEIEESKDLQEISQIVEYALPKIQGHVREGKEIYEEIDSLLHIEPIGITPLYRQEGYIFFRIETQPTLQIYQYRVVFMENVEANYYGISFDPREEVRISLSRTYESLKVDLIRNNPALPNPATYLMLANRNFPTEPSLVPIAKRKMLGYLKNE